MLGVRLDWVCRMLAFGLALAGAWDGRCGQSGNHSVPSAVPSDGESAWLTRLGSRGVRVHDPSTVVKCKDQFWVFYTGRGIPSYRSKDMVRWESGPPVLTNAPDWVAEVVPANRSAYFWAPDIIHLDDCYLLYYSVSSFGKNTSAIGLVTNPTLDPDDPQYRWKDQGVVVRSSAKDDFNTIDPSVVSDEQGGLWLAFGSFWSGIKLVQLDRVTGKRIAPNSPIFSLAFKQSIEGACLYRRGKYYYLFLNWGRCCRGVESTYNIRVGRSDNIVGPYRDLNGVDMLSGGGSLVLETCGPFIGPGHAGIISVGDNDWFSCHFYDGTRSGKPTLSILPLRWTSAGWPEVALPPR